MKINFENKFVNKTIDNIFLTLFLIPFAVLVISARIFFFLALLTFYPILLILKKISNGKWNPRSPFKYLKSTIEQSNSFFLDILDFCLYCK